MLRKWLFSLRTLAGKGRAEVRMDGELEFHIEQETRFNIERGMSPEEARRQALIAFGASPAIVEECREAWGFQALDNLRRDAAYAIRSLRKTPGYAALVILTLALGIGSNTALFSALNSVVLRPLPVDAGDRIVALTAIDPGTGRPRVRFSFPELRTYRQRTTLLDAIEELHTMTFTLLGRGEAENVETAVVPASYFDSLGIHALHGRTFVKGEDNPSAPPALVLNYRYFMGSFGGDPSVVGTTVRMNDRTHTIVGVLPPLAEFPAPIDLYMPTSSCPTRGNPAFENNRKGSMLRLYGRMKNGVKPEQVRSEFDSVYRSYRQDNRDIYNDGVDWNGQATPLPAELSKAAKPVVYFLFAITGLVLLIACASVANLSLARMLRREREFAIRAAIGGTRARLFQQLAVEALIVSMSAGVLGLLGAQASLSLLAKFLQNLSPRAGEVALDMPVLIFCFAVSTVTGVLFCALPAWRSRIDLTSAMKDSSPATTAGAGRRQARRMLVGAQVAFSFVVLIAAGLLIRSFVNLLQTDPGFQPQRIISMRVNANWSKVATTEQFQQFHEMLLERVRNTPGVLSAGMSGNVPLARANVFTTNLEIDGNPGGSAASIPAANLCVASAGYFETLGIPLLNGRTFSSADQPKSPLVAIVDATMAKSRWHGENPVGRRLRVPLTGQEFTVIGVVGAIRSESLNRDPNEQLYLAASQFPGGTDVVVRTAIEPEKMIGDLRRVVHQMDPDQAVASIKTMEDAMDQNLTAPRITMRLVGLLAGLTLLITVAGIGGVAALSTSQRRPEIGLRMMLGASAPGLVAMIVRQELVMVAGGLAVGAGGALIVSRWLGAFLYGTHPTDAATFVAAAAVMLACGAAACLGPALRAIRIDPVKTLRST